MAPQPVQLFWQGSRSLQRDRQTDRRHYFISSNRLHLASSAMLLNNNTIATPKLLCREFIMPNLLISYTLTLSAHHATSNAAWHIHRNHHWWTVSMQHTTIILQVYNYLLVKQNPIASLEYLQGFYTGSWTKSMYSHSDDVCNQLGYYTYIKCNSTHIVSSLHQLTCKEQSTLNEGDNAVSHGHRAYLDEALQ